MSLCLQEERSGLAVPQKYVQMFVIIVYIFRSETTGGKQNYICVPLSGIHICGGQYKYTLDPLQLEHIKHSQQKNPLSVIAPGSPIHPPPPPPPQNKNNI